ncbi:unnamed protein product [Linum tenue]|uniref:Trichome birefringence-like N-terminal domain-containing protein n=1 Tax=Linum tenue TaxID=586396 RepID=A0AAV0P9U4_9ROSI|nr:unnamed protein product [Linum tenue]
MESAKKLSAISPRTHLLFALIPPFVFLIAFLCLSPAFTTTSTNNFASRLLSSPFISSLIPPSESHQIRLPTAAAIETVRWKSTNEEELGSSSSSSSSCDIFDGNWVPDDDSDPLYSPGSCPFLDNSFNCLKNGRPDSGYLKFRWKPYGCEIPRFNGRKMLELLRGKRLVFVGDSLNRNMWQALVCSLRESAKNKTGIFEVFGRREFRTQGFYSVRFPESNCSLDFVKSPFLVQEWKSPGSRRRETLRLDMIQGSFSDYRDADVIVFNTGHWWTHRKTNRGKNYYQEGSHVYSKLRVTEAYKKALTTWSQWVDSNINGSRTRVFFRGYSASHFGPAQRCDDGGAAGPVTNEAELGAGDYPWWMMKAVESVIGEMKTPVFYLNVTKMTSYRRDGHPSIYHERRAAAASGGGGAEFQDCSHWCLPGVPDAWNQLLYAALLVDGGGGR